MEGQLMRDEVLEKRVTKKRARLKLPGIGMRIVKSSVAILVCYLVNMLRGDQGMVFYTQLAALWCIQMYRSNTKQNALQRTVGTVIGAVYGLLYLLIAPLFIKEQYIGRVLSWVVISVMIALVLYTSVLLRRQQAAYFSCVVYLSIVINHVQDLDPYRFVLNRFLDTMIGIAVGIVVNDLRLCFHPDRKTLFISGLDGMLLDENEMLNSFSKVELNRMIDDGMQFTISTMRTPASIIEPMKDIRLKLPVIAMNGAVLYDMNEHSYIKAYVISKETAQVVRNHILKAGLCSYANVLIDDMLVIYYDDTDDAVNRELVRNLRTSPFRNYVRKPLPEDEAVVYFMLLDDKERIDTFYQSLVMDGYAERLRIITYDSTDYPGYAYIKIYNRNATKENMIAYLKEQLSVEKAVTFGTIPARYDVYIDTEDANRVIREVRKKYEPIFK